MPTPTQVFNLRKKAPSTATIEEGAVLHHEWIEFADKLTNLYIDIDSTASDATSREAIAAQAQRWRSTDPKLQDLVEYTCDDRTMPFSVDIPKAPLRERLRGTYESSEEADKALVVWEAKLYLVDASKHSALSAIERSMS